MKSRSIIAAAFALVVAASAGAAQASETIEYTYDVQGRLTEAKHVGGPLDGQKTGYTYDAAGNRTQVTFTPPKRKVVVLPFLGSIVLPIHN